MRHQIGKKNPFDPVNDNARWWRRELREARQVVAGLAVPDDLAAAWGVVCAVACIDDELPAYMFGNQRTLLRRLDKAGLERGCIARLEDAGVIWTGTRLIAPQSVFLVADPETRTALTFPGEGWDAQTQHLAAIDNMNLDDDERRLAGFIIESMSKHTGREWFDFDLWLVELTIARQRDGNRLSAIFERWREAGILIVDDRASFSLVSLRRGVGSVGAVSP